MTMLLSQEQELLKDSAVAFLAQEAPVAQQRRLRDDKDTIRAFKDHLDEFIMELMDHINLENQVLFPRALAGEIF